MAVYVVNTGKTAVVSNGLKIAVQVATGAGITCKLVQWDVSFDGADATKTPIRVELVKTTGASSGGAAGTFTQVQGKTRTVQASCRTNDTSDGSSPTVLAAWEVSPTSGMSMQYPLGREVEMDASSYLEIRITTVTASGTPNYDVNVWIEE